MSGHGKGDHGLSPQAEPCSVPNVSCCPGRPSVLLEGVGLANGAERARLPRGTIRPREAVLYFWVHGWTCRHMSLAGLSELRYWELSLPAKTPSGRHFLV